MRNISKMSTLEQKFPLLAIENGCIISKDADITVAFEMELPELFTITSDEYEAMHSTWYKSIKVLPNYTIVHKQDWFIMERYESELQKEDISFLGRAYEKHFNERPFLNHSVYLFITKTNRQKMMQQSNFSTLCRGNILPKEITDKEGVNAFLEAVDQFERIMNSSGFFTLKRFDADEIAGTSDKPGLLDRYFSLSESNHASLEDIRLGADEVRIGDKILCLHTLSDTDDLPAHVVTDYRHERLSTDRSDCRLSFAAPVGLLLSCDHIYNQYIFIDDSAENLKKFERQARNMHSLSRYSRANQINKEWLEEYMNTAHSKGLTSIRAHFNVLAWSDDREQLKHIKNDVGSALAMMECKPRHNTIDTATLYWAAMPGNAADFPAEESFYTFIEPALCFFTAETNYKDSLSPFGIKMADRMSGKPLHLDISDLPMKKGITTNRNKFILGPSGSGKSFFTNHMIRQYYEQGTHVLLVDTGNSYQGLCSLIQNNTKGNDGIYFTYTEENPISFNPFYTDDKVFDIEKEESICALILTLWKGEDKYIEKTESNELGTAIHNYIRMIQKDEKLIPCFNTFYEYLRDVYRVELQSRDIKVSKEDVIEGLKSFEGEISQLPPIYSAIKVKGKKLYEYARSGQEVEIKPRKVTIENIELKSFDEKLQQAEILIKCSKGTYIRSIANDLGQKLECGAHLIKLVRTQAGRFRIENSVNLEGLDIVNNLINPVDMLNYPEINVNCVDMEYIRNGRALKNKNIKHGSL